MIPPKADAHKVKAKPAFGVFWGFFLLLARFTPLARQAEKFTFVRRDYASPSARLDPLVVEANKVKARPAFGVFWGFFLFLARFTPLARRAEKFTFLSRDYASPAARLDPLVVEANKVKAQLAFGVFWGFFLFLARFTPLA